MINFEGSNHQYLCAQYVYPINLPVVETHITDGNMIMLLQKIIRQLGANTCLSIAL